VLTLDGYPHRGQPIMLTEFGGIAFIPESRRRNAGWGYSKVATKQDYARLLNELLEAVIMSPLFSGFCYTQFADTFQEMNGLLTADRKPKLPLEQIARMVKLTRTHIAGVV
jgi:hypothetical protein